MSNNISHISHSSQIIKKCKKDGCSINVNENEDFCLFHKSKLGIEDINLIAKNTVQKKYLNHENISKLIEEYLPKIKKNIEERKIETKDFKDILEKNHIEIISKIINRIIRGDIEQPEEVYKKYYKKLKKKENDPSYRRKQNEREQNDNLAKLFLENIARTNSMDTGVSLIDSVWEYYKSLALKMREDIIREYKCNTSLEKSLVDMVVNSYINKITASKRIDSLIRENWDYYGEDKMTFLNLLYKQEEKYTKQYLESLRSLIQIKQPNLNIKINANNAFVAQNQQINNNQENNESN